MKNWKNWLNLILGLLVVAFAFTGYHVIRFVITGAIVATLSFWAAIGKETVK